MSSFFFFIFFLRICYCLLQLLRVLYLYCKETRVFSSHHLPHCYVATCVCVGGRGEKSRFKNGSCCTEERSKNWVIF